jgi:hypothetical protein
MSNKDKGQAAALRPCGSMKTVLRSGRRSSSHLRQITARRSNPVCFIRDFCRGGVGAHMRVRDPSLPSCRCANVAPGLGRRQRCRGQFTRSSVPSTKGAHGNTSRLPAPDVSRPIEGLGGHTPLEHRLVARLAFRIDRGPTRLGRGTRRHVTLFGAQGRVAGQSRKARSLCVVS